jgi:nicotinate-nucleotide adenylyltransferase
MRLGIFGGTFDPPHIAHLILAAVAHAQLGLERVLWVLTPAPPHKNNHLVTPLDARLEMLRAALADAPAFELSRVDIDRPPPHYAVDTLRLLHQEYSHATLVYLLGGDSLADVPLWHRPCEFVKSCDEIGVMLRPQEAVDVAALEARLPGLGERLRWVHAPLLEISSSYIRQQVAAGRPYRYYLPEAVYQIIAQRGLYLR